VKEKPLKRENTKKSRSGKSTRSPDFRAESAALTEINETNRTPTPKIGIEFDPQGNPSKTNLNSSAMVRRTSTDA